MNKRILWTVFGTGICASVLWVWAVTTPPAGSVIEDHESTAGSSYIGTYQGNLLQQGQQFYLDASDEQPVSGIGIWIRDTDYGDPSGDVTLAVYANASGNVPGALVAGTSQSFTPVLGEWNYILFTDPGVMLNTGDSNKYWLVASVEDQTGDNDAYCWYRSGSNTYDRGYRKTFNLDGTEEWSGSQSGDFAFRIYGDATLSVSWSSFNASLEEGGVVLRWETASEAGTLGFFVLRSDDEKGPYIRIHTEIIPAQGEGSQGASYRFTDKEVSAGAGYWYQVVEVASDGQGSVIGPICIRVPWSQKPPESCRLYGNYPNPFNPSTTIRYRVSGGLSSLRAALRIYSIMGREVVTLVDRIHESGDYSVDWNGCDACGSEVSSGSYLVQLTSDGQVVDTGRMVKLK
jgi:hypothetical protein